MKKIVFLMLSRGVGGIEKRMATLYKYVAINDFNIKVTFVINRAQIDLLDAYATTITHRNTEIVKFGLPYKQNVFSNSAFWYLVDYMCLAITLMLCFSRKRFGVAYFTKFSSLPFRKLVRSDLKVLSFVDSHNPARILDSKRIKKILRESFRIDCLSEDLRKKVLKLKDADERQVFNTPCSFIDYSETAIGIKNRVVCFVGRFVDGKGIDILLPALPAIIDKHPDLVIKLLGAGEYESRIIEFIKRNKFEKIQVGFCKDPIGVLKESMIFLSLQEKENYPSQSLIEAMACGNAVIATDVGMTAKIVSGEVGLLIKRDPDELIKAMDQLLSNETIALEMGRKAREKVINEHTVDRFWNYLRESFICKSQDLPV
jgi:glycosyltransferase involved in cell wall biosynthesis